MSVSTVQYFPMTTLKKLKKINKSGTGIAILTLNHLPCPIEGQETDFAAWYFYYMQPYTNKSFGVTCM